MHPVINAMLQRVSSPKLMAPAPSREELEIMFQCAVRAPDHARLRPWRFVVLEGEALAQLGQAFVATEPNADDARTARLGNMPLRAPMIIIVIATLQPDHGKVPVWEQQVAVGIATQHLQLAAEALGYGAMWRTGDMAEQAAVKDHLDLKDNEQIIAYLYVGTVAESPKPAPVQALAPIVDYRQ